MSLELLTTFEVAQLLRTTPAGIHALRYRGEGPPAIRVGRRLLWDRSDVERWIAKRRERGEAG